jgi:methanogenic corrinoid protein MtbC1
MPETLVNGLAGTFSKKLPNFKKTAYLQRMNPTNSNLDDILLLHQNEIAEKIVELQYGRQPAFWKPYGSAGRRLSLRDAGYHLPFLSESITAGNPDIFREYVRWVKKLFRGLKFPDEVMKTTLECTRTVLEEYLDEELMVKAYNYIDYGIREMNSEIDGEVSMIVPANPHFQLATEFHETLVRGDRNAASRLIIKAVENGVPVKDIYMHVFQVSQYEVGRRWLASEISVAQEHFCSAATQMIMSQLYPYIFSGDKSGKSMVAASIGGELHEIGIRMVSDFFEMDGWNTFYLGANAPTSSILKAADLHHATLIALSIAMPYHGHLLKQTIEEIRLHPLGADLKILVGGNAVIRRNGDYKAFGADGFAADAETAVELANQLVK